jgi:hypothetical protein
MQVGDLVEVVQSERDTLKTPFVGQVGVIVKEGTPPWTDEEKEVWYNVFTRERILLFRGDYLEEIK